jgi:hypothetical protein
VIKGRHREEGGKKKGRESRKKIAVFLLILPSAFPFLFPMSSLVFALDRKGHKRENGAKEPL